MPAEYSIPDVQLAVDDGRLLDLAQRLIEIPSENPPGNERLAAEFLADYFAGSGWAVELSEVAPGRPNVVARIAGRAPGPRLIFDGHLDVVPAGDGWTRDPFKPTVKDGRLVGRGAADMKGGLAAMIAAAEAVQRAEVPLQGELVLAAVADEEEGNLGTRRLVQSGLRGTWAIVPEPTELLPVVAHKGSANIHVAIHGSAAHASTPEQGVNAINHASALIARLNALNVDYQRIRQHDLLGSPTLTICTINGGFNDYTVPAACALTLNRRLVPPETDRDVIAELSGVFDELAQTDPSFKADLQLSAFTPPMETDVDSEVVRALRSASARVSGVDPRVSGWSATCDASILSHAANIPTVVFGPGSIARDAHRPDESVAVSELVACARIFAITIQELLGGEA